MKFIIFTLILFYLSFSVSGQNLGYLGKKRSLGIGVDTWTSMYYGTHSIITKTYQTAGGDVALKPLKLVFRPKVTYRKTIGKGAELGVDFQYFTFYQYVDNSYQYTSIPYDQTYYSVNNYYGSTSSSYSTTSTNTVQGNAGAFQYSVFKGRTLSLGFCINDFFDGDIAPVGKYITYKFKIYQTILADYKKDIEVGTTNALQNFTYTIPNTAFLSYQLGIGLHKRSIIKDEFFMDFGFDVSFGYNPLWRSDSHNSYLNNNHYYMNRYVLGASHMMFSVILGKIL